MSYIFRIVTGDTTDKPQSQMRKALEQPISKLPSLGNAPCTSMHSGCIGSLPPLRVAAGPCVVPGTGDPGVLVCLRGRAVPTPPHWGSLPGTGSPVPHRDLLSPVQGWGCLEGMAVPLSFSAPRLLPTPYRNFHFCHTAYQTVSIIYLWLCSCCSMWWVVVLSSSIALSVWGKGSLRGFGCPFTHTVPHSSLSLVQWQGVGSRRLVDGLPDLTSPRSFFISLSHPVLSWSGSVLLTCISDNILDAFIYDMHVFMTSVFLAIFKKIFSVQKKQIPLQCHL